MGAPIDKVSRDIMLSAIYLKFCRSCDVAVACWTGRSTSCLRAFPGVLDTSDIKFFDHDKESSTSQLIKDKSRDLQTLTRYFDKAATSAYLNPFLSGSIRDPSLFLFTYQQIVSWHNNIKIFCTVCECIIDFWYEWI